MRDGRFFGTLILGYIEHLRQLDDVFRMSDAPHTLSAQGLVRRFGAHRAVDRVSLQLRRGEVLGLLGHNGAGKSTTLQMLAGVLLPHAGTVEICGFDLMREPGEAKSRIGFLPEVPPLYREMYVDDYLRFTARLRRLPQEKVTHALSAATRRCGLADVGQKIIGTLSKGYQQRVGIAQAIIHEPEVVILDEPTAGLDPAQLRDIRALIRELGNTHSVVFSTHVLGEVESVCDRIEIMHRGQVVFDGHCADLRQYGNRTTSLEDAFMQITESAANNERELQAQ